MKTFSFSDLTNSDTWVNVWHAILPWIYGIILIVVVYFVAKIVRGLLVKALDKIKIDAKATKLLHGKGKLSLVDPVATVVYYLIWLLALPTILEKFNLSSLATSINSLIDDVMNFIPNLVSAILIFAIFYFIANGVKTVIEKVLEGIDMKNWLTKIGLKGLVEKVDPVKLLSNIAFFIILLTAINQSLRILALPVLSDIADTVLIIAGNVLFGSIIIAIGVWIANFVSDLIVEHSGQKNTALLAKYVIIALIGMTGIEQMGLQTAIITDAARMFIAAIALGFAIAMGLGAKETIGNLVSDTLKKFK
ncbi:hypothetical protein CSB09_00565 [Candidatus Gracilibacteria bacterium]|nr:MAG: hypothetical protein CSB09_00565 [Candidatus Gracilibacteria bacterium]